MQKFACWPAPSLCCLWHWPWNHYKIWNKQQRLSRLLAQHRLQEGMNILASSSPRLAGDGMDKDFHQPTKISTISSQQRLQQDNNANSSLLSPTNKVKTRAFALNMKWCSNQHLEDGSFDSRICQYSMPYRKGTSILWDGFSPLNTPNAVRRPPMS